MFKHPLIPFTVVPYESEDRIQYSSIFCGLSRFKLGAWWEFDAQFTKPLSQNRVCRGHGKIVLADQKERQMDVGCTR